VGLPTLKDFYTDSAGAGNGCENRPDFFAWPNSKVPANVALDIHRNAFPRSCINGYTRIRGVLVTVAKQILAIDFDRKKGDADNNPEKIWKEIVERLPRQIKMFRDAGHM